MNAKRLIGWILGATLLALASPVEALTSKDVVGRDFELVDADGNVLAKKMRLLEGGALKGVRSTLAKGWAITDRIVVFYGAGKTIVCRFTRIRISNGKLAMQGEAAASKKTWVLREVGYKAPYKAPRARVTRKQVMSRTFTFRARGGKIFAKKVRLGPKGKVIGHEAINAARWDLKDGKVLFYDTKGKISVRFTAIRIVRNKLEMMGAFRKNSRLTLVLREH